MINVLKQEFFNRPTLAVARELIGKYLVRKKSEREVALIITEVEAYDGPYDRASHASRGLTKRNSAMFGPAGKFYVYFTYGRHWMLNVVTGPENYPAAVLVRGAGDISGPARLTKFLAINKSLNGKPARRKTGLWFEDRGVKIKPRNIKRLTRVGVDYAGPVWSKKPYRFIYRYK